jgi:hypothetical protein
VLARVDSWAMWQTASVPDLATVWNCQVRLSKLASIR